ncbi:phage portal protein [Nocardia tengchongensis]
MKDVDVVESPAWWLNFLGQRFNERDRTYDLPLHPHSQQLIYRTRRQRLNLLWSYYIGQPPLPNVAEGYTDAFCDVLRKGRATYAPMAITPMLDRMQLNGVSTAVDDTPDGDDTARKIMEYSNFAAAIKDAFTFQFVMSEAYLMIVPAADGAPDKTPLITAEDPRTCIGQPDPMNPNQLRAALKIGYDPVREREIAWLFVGGMRHQASRASTPIQGGVFSAAGFEWDAEPVHMPELAGIGQVPVVQLINPRGMGEFEPHLDLLDRINDTILQRIVLTWYQSFRQRAVIADLEGDEDDQDAPVEEVDWANVFRADPGALWRVPAGTTFWESNQADLTPVLVSIRDDVKEFAAVTSTPLHLITPDAANQSAEGASLMREGLVFKVKDRRARVTPRLIEAWKIAFAFAGEAQRGSDIKLNWGNVESFSLTERSNAIAQTRGVLSRERQLTDIMEMTPVEAQANLQDLIQDRILDSQLTPQVPAQSPEAPAPAVA